MQDDVSCHDALPPSLQVQLDRTLAVGENTLMSLTGAMGEALAVTDKRVVILREQMPVVGSETQVDCFDYSYEQIRTVRVESAAGGGHLLLVLFAPPPDDHRVTLYFPSYEQTKFEVAAARIRLLTEQMRSAPDPPRVSPPPAAEASRTCPRCSAGVTERDLFCSACGAAVCKVCGFCNAPIPLSASFCVVCGGPASRGRELACSACGHSLSPAHAFCPACGQAQAVVCGRCGTPSPSAWSHCAQCGQPLQAIPTVSGGNAGVSDVSPTAAPHSAQEHNERGMRLYEQERYEEAVAEFEVALDLAPGTPIYHCNLGVAYAEMARDDEAVEEYQVAIRLAPNDPSAYLNLGYFYAAREQPGEAKRWWSRAVEVAPGSAEGQEAQQNLDHADEL